MGPPAWIVGPVVAVGALLSGSSSHLFASDGGILIAAGVAFWSGSDAMINESGGDDRRERVVPPGGR
jgi:hypothetical protein